MKICKKCGIEKEEKSFPRKGEWINPTCRLCYIKDTCAKCGKIKETKSHYCRSCQKARNRLVRNRIRTTKDEIREFCLSVINNKMMITIYDINNIITYYQFVSSNTVEYDMYDPGKQIQLMFKKISKEVGIDREYNF